MIIQEQRNPVQHLAHSWETSSEHLICFLIVAIMVVVLFGVATSPY